MIETLLFVLFFLKLLSFTITQIKLKCKDRSVLLKKAEMKKDPCLFFLFQCPHCGHCAEDPVLDILFLRSYPALTAGWDAAAGHHC